MVDAGHLILIGVALFLFGATLANMTGRDQPGHFIAVVLGNASFVTGVIWWVSAR